MGRLQGLTTICALFATIVVHAGQQVDAKPRTGNSGQSAVERRRALYQIRNDLQNHLHKLHLFLENDPNVSLTTSELRGLRRDVRDYRAKLRPRKPHGARAAFHCNRADESLRLVLEDWNQHHRLDVSLVKDVWARLFLARMEVDALLRATDPFPFGRICTHLAKIERQQRRIIDELRLFVQSYVYGITPSLDNINSYPSAYRHMVRSTGHAEEKLFRVLIKATDMINNARCRMEEQLWKVDWQPQPAPHLFALRLTQIRTELRMANNSLRDGHKAIDQFYKKLIWQYDQYDGVMTGKQYIKPLADLLAPKDGPFSRVDRALRQVSVSLQRGNVNVKQLHDVNQQLMQLRSRVEDVLNRLGRPYPPVCTNVFGRLRDLEAGQWRIATDLALLYNCQKREK